MPFIQSKFLLKQKKKFLRSLVPRVYNQIMNWLNSLWGMSLLVSYYCLLFFFRSTYAYTLTKRITRQSMYTGQCVSYKAKYIVWIFWVALHLFQNLFYFFLNLACSVLTKPMSMINDRGGNYKNYFFSMGSSSFIQV